MRVNLDPADRTALVRRMFTQIVPRYDLLNRIHSLGRDVFWRQATARRAKVFDTGRVLDLATGTGDLAMTLAEQFHGSRVIGIDFTLPMVQRAGEKVLASEYGGRVFLSGADALRLPFPDKSFDSVTMAFGIRNIPDRRAALKEMRRVLVPGGRALILEFTFPHWSFFRRIYETYLTRLIPRLGGLISGDRQAYQYLADSILDFPSPQAFCQEMAQAGFSRTGFVQFTFGVAILHWGEREIAPD